MHQVEDHLRHQAEVEEVANASVGEHRQPRSGGGVHRPGVGAGVVGEQRPPAGVAVVLTVALAEIAGAGNAVEAVVAKRLSRLPQPVLLGAERVRVDVEVVVVGVGRAGVRGLSAAAAAVLERVGAPVGPHVVVALLGVDHQRLAVVAPAVAVDVVRERDGERLGSLAAGVDRARVIEGVERV